MSKERELIRELRRALQAIYCWAAPIAGDNSNKEAKASEINSIELADDVITKTNAYLAIPDSDGVDNAMVRRFVDAINPMMYHVPPPGQIRKGLVAAITKPEK